MEKATQFVIANPDGSVTMRVHGEKSGEIYTTTEKNVPNGKILDWGRKQRVKGMRQPKTGFGWVDKPNNQEGTGTASRTVEFD